MDLADLGYAIDDVRDFCTEKFFYFFERSKSVFDDVMKKTHTDRHRIHFHFREQIRYFERMGQVFLAAKKTGLALSAFNKAAEKRGSSVGNLSFNIASVYLQEDKAEEALEEIQRVLLALRRRWGAALYARLQCHLHL